MSLAFGRVSCAVGSGLPASGIWRMPCAASASIKLVSDMPGAVNVMVGSRRPPVLSPAFQLRGALTRPQPAVEVVGTAVPRPAAT